MLSSLGKVGMLGFGVCIQVVLVREGFAAQLTAEEEALDVDVDEVISQLALVFKNFFAKVAALGCVGVLTAGFASSSFSQILDDNCERIVGIKYSFIITLWFLLSRGCGFKEAAVNGSHVRYKAVMVGKHLDAVLAFQFPTPFLPS